MPCFVRFTIYMFQCTELLTASFIHVYKPGRQKETLTIFAIESIILSGSCSNSEQKR